MNNTGSYITDGISQQDRYPVSLNPDYFLLDERTVDDLLLFITELSFEYNYYDAGNNLNGDWLDFFLSDPNLMLRIFPYYDFKRFSLEYDRMKQELSLEINENKLAAKLQSLVEFIYHFLAFQSRMFEKFKSSIFGADHFKLNEFTGIVGTDDDYQLARRRFYSLSLQIESHLEISLEGIDKTMFFPNAADLPKTDFYDSFSLYSSISGNAMQVFDDLFLKFELLHNRLINASNYFLQKQKREEVSFRPHISLVIAFLELYQSLKDEFNQFTCKHLEFYYNKVLGIESKKAVADKVSVMLTLNKGISEFLVEKGEKMLAAIPGQAKKEIFNVVEDILVNRGRIVALKTIYKSEYHNFLYKKDIDPVKEYMIYAADNPVVEAGDYGKNSYTGKAWPLFGQDQGKLPAEEYTMREADLGILITSALLYAVDGKRTYSIKFHLARNQFDIYFTRQVMDYEKATGIDRKVIISEMLKEAFIINITGADGWIKVPEYSTKCPFDEGLDKIIEIHFTLLPDDPAVANYQPGVHGGNFNATRPALKLMLNNKSFQNPYAFFCEQIIERITIQVKVSESSSLLLQNNTGKLSMSNPFQIFGPQPTIGAYIDIKNTNIFNRFTKDFSIKLKWFDLPKNKDGFKAFYEGYRNEITNESFKVGISGLIDDTYLPKTDEQQVFNLFQMNNSSGLRQYLSNTTVIDHIDLGKIRFDNEPLLQDEEASGPDFKNGAVRIELQQPADAFGHRLYPVIFPKILMHNSKWYFKNWLHANPPYAPMVRSVLVDYTLQHSEAMTGKHKAQEQCEIEFLHICPFGFKKTYPQNKKQDLKFIPTIADEGNLFIGLTDILPGKVLTLLFQMEENNFQQLEEETNPVSWSYLDDNEWKPIVPTDVLEDNTINFKGTGVIKLILPENISNGNTLFDPELYWIKVSCKQYIASRVTGIFTQVLTAIRELDASNENAGSFQLDQYIIGEFARRIPEIQTVFQPFQSYHGSAAETKGHFYTWVSEHLHHKQRLITAEDISQKVLELFPQIHKVICFRDDAGRSAGHNGADLQVVVIPKIRRLNEDEVAEPKTDIYTLYKIRNYLRKHISPFLKQTLTVRNPDYERIKVFCTVVFREVQKDRSTYMLVQNLNRDIRKFISPWLFLEDAEINSNNWIYPSEILNFIKELPYISFVSGFNVVHFYNHYNLETGLEEARVMEALALRPRQDNTPFILGRQASNKKLLFKGSKPGAILISSEDHLINVKKSDKTVFNREDAVLSPETGVGRLSIGKEFLVMKPYSVDEYAGVMVPSRPEAEDEIDFYFNANS